MQAEILDGVRIYTNEHLVLQERKQVERTWRERLFTLPWRPLRRYRTIVTCRPNPSPMLMYVNGQPIFFMHPETFQQLKETLKPWPIKARVLSNV